MFLSNRYRVSTNGCLVRVMRHLVTSNRFIYLNGRVSPPTNLFLNLSFSTHSLVLSIYWPFHLLFFGFGLVQLCCREGCRPVAILVVLGSCVRVSNVRNCVACLLVELAFGAELREESLFPLLCICHGRVLDGLRVGIFVVGKFFAVKCLITQ